MARFKFKSRDKDLAIKFGDYLIDNGVPYDVLFHIPDTSGLYHTIVRIHSEDDSLVTQFVLSEEGVSAEKYGDERTLDSNITWLYT